MDSTNKVLPQRFREGPFRFYEPFIARALKVWPSHIAVKPSFYQLSSETFAARFRDAKLSYASNKWPSTLIDPNMYANVGHLLQASVRGDTVLIGSRESITNASQVVPEVVEVANIPVKPFHVGFISEGKLTILATLAAARKLTCPISFSFADNSTFINKVLELNDVDIVQKDNLYILT